MRWNQIIYKIVSHRQSKNKREIIESVTTSALTPVSAALTTGWCKEACARRESSPVLIALGTKICPLPFLLLPSFTGGGKAFKSTEKANSLPQILGSSKKLLAVQKQHQEIPMGPFQEGQRADHMQLFEWYLKNKKLNSSDTPVQKNMNTLCLRCLQAHYILLKVDISSWADGVHAERVM